MDKYQQWVQTYAFNRYGKENIINQRFAHEVGVLGATEFTLKDESKIVVYFHYQLEKVCVAGEPYWL